jgi:hypothetical protein
LQLNFGIERKRDVAKRCNQLLEEHEKTLYEKNQILVRALEEVICADKMLETFSITMQMRRNANLVYRVPRFCSET